MCFASSLSKESPLQHAGSTLLLLAFPPSTVKVYPQTLNFLSCKIVLITVQLPSAFLMCFMCSVIDCDAIVTSSIEKIRVYITLCLLGMPAERMWAFIWSACTHTASAVSIKIVDNGSPTSCDTCLHDKLTKIDG